MQICESEVFVRLFFTFMLANICIIPFLQVVCQQETELRLWLFPHFPTSDAQIYDVLNPPDGTAGSCCFPNDY
jgi:hypothetical protein